MQSVKFADIVVRRVTDKGTKIIEEPVKPVNFMGEDLCKKQEESLLLAGDLWVMSAKGTKMINLKELQRPKASFHEGRYISTGRGTGRKQL